ncbi:MAG: hypothetical protein HZA53_10450 [Planctomycetes bacterium]|nr:hypothetical protein [Planctomycetota bacterium]
MDALLVLCNLHADGPGTWRRLRARGIARPAELAAVPVDRLAEWLGGTPATARRFLREARRCASAAPWTNRVEETVLEASTPPWPERAVEPAPRVPERASEPAPRLEVPAPRANVRSWPLDELAPRSALPSTKIASPAPTRADAAPRDETPGLLRPGRAPGLDLAACQRLVGAGVRTWEQLGRVPAARLAAATGIAAEELRAWQERAHELEFAACDESEPVVELHPAPRAPLARTAWSPEPPRAKPAHEARFTPVIHELEDVAGPFA